MKINIHLALICSLAPFFLRANLDGTLDNLFGTTGQVRTLFSAPTTGQIPRTMRLQCDGKVVIAGRNNQPGGPCTFIQRYKPDGTLDVSFGASGEVIECFAGGTFYLSDMVIQPDGKIVGGIVTPIAGNDTLVVARFLENGQLDNSFGTNGFAQHDIAVGGAFRMLAAFAIDHNENIVVATSTTTTNTGVVARFTPQGSIDTSFGTNGITTLDPLDFGGTIINFFGIKIQSDNKIVAFGAMLTTGDLNAVLQSDGSIAGVPQEVFFVARFLPSGAIDTTFGQQGAAIVAAGAGAGGGAIQDDGKILAYGSLNTPPLYVIRLDQQGRLDASFGNQGVGTYPLSGNINNMNCMALQPDQKILVANSFSVDASANNLTFTAVRILPDGTIDRSFGDEGYVNTFVLGRPNCQTFACITDFDNNLYITGTVENIRVGITRYTVDSLNNSSFYDTVIKRYCNETVIKNNRV